MALMERAGRGGPAHRRAGAVRGLPRGARGTAGRAAFGGVLWPVRADPCRCAGAGPRRWRRAAQVAPRRQRPRPPQPTGRGQSPPARRATSLVGRARELALLGERLADAQCRWLTIVGPGGVGKTRLAQRRSREHFGPRFRHGVLWFSGRDPGGALRDAETLAQHVLEHDRRRPRHAGALLLVLDNLETVPRRAHLAPLLARAAGHQRAGHLAAPARRQPRRWLLELPGLSLARAADGRPASSAAAALLAQARAPAGRASTCARTPSGGPPLPLVGGLPLALSLAARVRQQHRPARRVERLQAGELLADPDRRRRRPPAQHASACSRNRGPLLDERHARRRTAPGVGSRADVDAALAARRRRRRGDLRDAARRTPGCSASGDEPLGPAPAAAGLPAAAPRRRSVARRSRRSDGCAPRCRDAGRGAIRRLAAAGRGRRGRASTLGDAERLVRSAAGSAAVLAAVRGAPLHRRAAGAARAVDRSSGGAARPRRPPGRSGSALAARAAAVRPAAVAACRLAAATRRVAQRRRTPRCGRGRLLAGAGRRRAGRRGFDRAPWASLPRAVARMWQARLAAARRPRAASSGC